MKQALLFLLLFASLTLQGINVDSLEIAIAKLPPTDTLRLKSEYKIAVNCQFDNLKKSTALCEQGYRNALQIKSTRFQYLFLYMLGTNYQYSLEYEKSISSFEKAIALAKAENNYARMVNCYTNLANTYNNMSNLDKATELNLLAIDISKQHVPNSLWGMNYSNLAEAYIQMQDIERGLKYSQLALTDTVLGPTDLIVVYGNLCAIYSSMQKKDSALYYLKLVQQIANKHQLFQPEDIAVTHNAYANYALSFQVSDATPSMLKELIGACLSLEDSSKIAKAYKFMAQYFQVKKQYDSSNYYLLKATQMSQHSGDLFSLISMYDNLSKNAQVIHNWQEALQYAAMARTLTDSFHIIQNSKAVHNAEIKFDTKQKEAQNHVLAKENELKTTQKNVYLMSGLSITLILSWFLWSNFKSRRKAELLGKKIEEQKLALEESHKTKDKIFSVISHDLRAPIAGLSSLMTLKESGITLNDEKQHELDQKIGMSLKNTSVALDNLLLWSLAQMKREKSTSLEFNLNELIEQQINLFQTQCETKNIEVRFAPTRSYQLSHDKNGLSVIIRNILSNAIKFSHPASHIDIVLADEHEQLIIRITDYGVGMKEDQLLQFHRGELQHTTGTLSESGTGLGFLLVRDYCQALNVQLEVESNLGQGTTFTLIL